MPKFKHHIFICENERPADSPKGCCSARNAAAIRQALKDEIDRRDWKKIVRANGAGCLDQCSQGACMVIYPSNTWYGNVKIEDIPAILDALKENRTLERLRIPDEKLTGKACENGLP